MRDDKRHQPQEFDPKRHESRPHGPKGQPQKPDPEQEKKEKKKRRRRRKRRLIFFLILLLILIGLVLGMLYGQKMGLGDGWGFLPGATADKNGGTQGGGDDEKLSQADADNKPTSIATITPEPTKEAEGIAAPDAFITVSEDKILLNSTELDIDGLKAQLENAYKGGKVTLIDDYAIKDNYESVKSLLETLGITEYEEKKAE